MPDNPKPEPLEIGDDQEKKGVIRPAGDKLADGEDASLVDLDTPSL